MKRYVQGYFNTYPAPPKVPRATWDIQSVLEYLKSQPDNHELNINTLGPKVAMLILLSTVQCKSELLSISIKHMYTLPRCVSFFLVDPPKTYTVYNAREHLRWLTVKQLDSSLTDQKLCPVWALLMYLLKTKKIRNTDRVFICSTPPYTEISSMTLNCWILSLMKKAGIDVSMCGPYSTRHAASSKAIEKGMPIDQLLALGGWTRPSTFIQHYNIPIVKNAIQASQAEDNTDINTREVLMLSRYIPPLSNPVHRKKFFAQAAKKKALTTIQAMNTHQKKRRQRLREKAQSTNICTPSANTTNELNTLVPEVIATGETSKVEQTEHQFKVPDLPPQTGNPKPSSPSPPEISGVSDFSSASDFLALEDFSTIDLTQLIDECTAETKDKGKKQKTKQKKKPLPKVLLTDEPLPEVNDIYNIVTNCEALTKDYRLTMLQKFQSKLLEDVSGLELQEQVAYEALLRPMGFKPEFRSSMKYHLNLPRVDSNGTVTGSHKQVQMLLHPMATCVNAIQASSGGWIPCTGPEIPPKEQHAHVSVNTNVSQKRKVFSEKSKPKPLNVVEQIKTPTVTEVIEQVDIPSPVMPPKKSRIPKRGTPRKEPQQDYAEDDTVLYPKFRPLVPLPILKLPKQAETVVEHKKPPSPLKIDKPGKPLEKLNINKSSSPKITLASPVLDPSTYAIVQLPQQEIRKVLVQI